MFPVETLNYFLSLGTLGMEIVTVGLVVLLLTHKKVHSLDENATLLSRWGLWIGFLVAIVGVAMTLFYSEVLGFAPCGLCWLQRVCLYPQVVIFGIAAWKKDRGAALYSIALSVLGAIVALYNHYLQMGGTDIIPCPATRVNAAGITADCAQRFLFEFGYITFPFMSFSLFAFIIVLMLFVWQKPRPR